MLIEASVTSPTARASCTQSALPSGIVTFVFTDIVGSTRLLCCLGDDYLEVLDRHRALLRTAWAAHEGCEVHTVGDGSLVAFADSGSAVVACAEAQRSMSTECWPKDALVRVRMGIHRGPATPWRGDYAALVVHQASRIVDLATAGQVLVSESAVGAVIDPVASALLRRLGRVPLRDFDEPVTLFEVARAPFESVAEVADGQSRCRRRG
jgi:class 3 adenylate cyclase